MSFLERAVPRTDSKVLNIPSRPQSRDPGAMIRILASIADQAIFLVDSANSRKRPELVTEIIQLLQAFGGIPEEGVSISAVGWVFSVPGNIAGIINSSPIAEIAGETPQVL